MAGKHEKQVRITVLQRWVRSWGMEQGGEKEENAATGSFTRHSLGILWAFSWRTWMIGCLSHHFIHSTRCEMSHIIVCSTRDGWTRMKEKRNSTSETKRPRHRDRDIANGKGGGKIVWTDSILDSAVHWLLTSDLADHSPILDLFHG